MQKLTSGQKQQRVLSPKRLRKKFDTHQGNKLYRWEHVLNIDFRGLFTLTPSHIHHNEDVYTEPSSDVPYDLKINTKEEFQKRIMLWGGISCSVYFLNHLQFLSMNS